MVSLFPEPCPQLPPFSSLLVTGNYHPSAVLHLALSSLKASSAGEPIILVTSSQQRLSNALTNFNDDWLLKHAAEARVVRLSSQIRVFDVSSPAQLSMLLTMLGTWEGLRDEDDSWLNASTTLATAPMLIILHEVSEYFVESSDSWVLSSYLSLIVQAHSCCKAFSPGDGQKTSLALFDSRLESLRLPIIKRNQEETLGSEVWRDTTEPALTFVRKYFDCVAVVQSGEQLPTHQSNLDLSPEPAGQPDTGVSGVSEVDNSSRFLALSQNGTTHRWKWREVLAPVHGFNERAGVQFLWEN